jgi:hypothetical protein
VQPSQPRPMLPLQPLPESSLQMIQVDDYVIIFYNLLLLIFFEEHFDENCLLLFVLFSMAT